MPSVTELSHFLDQFAPTRLAENWDNVGLLVGDPAAHVERVMTCLTITPESAREAIENSVELIVSHHPLPFHATKRITTETIPGQLLWDLIRSGISIYSPHTGFDSAIEGINQQLSQRMGLISIEPLQPKLGDPDQLGAGRIGKLSDCTLADLLKRLKQTFELDQLQFIGDLNQLCQTVVAACGSGGSFLSAAAERGGDTFVTGEANFHTCLEAKARGISLILLGHYVSERFAIEVLANRLQTTFPQLKVWASRAETDPLKSF